MNNNQIDEIKYRLFVESVKDYAILMIDPKGYIISWNDGAKQIMGYNTQEIIGNHYSIFYPGEAIDRNEVEEHMRITYLTGRLETEGWRVRKDATEFWASTVMTSLKVKRGKFLGYGLVIKDISERKNAEEEISRLNGELTDLLQKSEIETNDYKHALDESSIVAVTDQKGIIRHVNDNFCRISKYNREELIGQDHRIINSGYHSKEFIRILWATIANGKIWKGELMNKAKDGSIYWVDTTIVPFLNDEGKPFQYLAIRTDITKRKQVEAQLISLNEELEKKIISRTLELTTALENSKELNEVKTRFVSLASHEFRTPLSAILSSLYLINHYLRPDDEAKRNKHFERIKSSVQNLTSILDDFLSVEKLEQGKVEITSSIFNLREFIEDIIEETEGLAKKKYQAIDLFCGEEIELTQDKKILRSILLNLLSNAIKYSPEGKRIKILSGLTGTSVYISVIDEGIGIPIEAQNDLFGIFFRAHNALNIQGTGLGLNLVKKYAELLGGSICFTSKENSGSAFTVEFPR